MKEIVKDDKEILETNEKEQIDFQKELTNWNLEIQRKGIDVQ